MNRPSSLCALACAALLLGGCMSAQPPAVVTQTQIVPPPVFVPQPVVNTHVHTGRITCDLGQHIDVMPDDARPGYFTVSGKGFRYHMQQVSTTTGVIRLEDTKAGAVWLQIANKSMLMNQKIGRRMADGCMSPLQVQVAQSMRNAPVNLLAPANP